MRDFHPFMHHPEEPVFRNNVLYVRENENYAYLKGGLSTAFKHEAFSESPNFQNNVTHIMCRPT